MRDVYKELNGDEDQALPAGVDETMARQSQDLIDSWRQGDSPADVTFRGLLRLYNSLPNKNDDTQNYALLTALEFPVAAGMSVRVSRKIWDEETTTRQKS